MRINNINTINFNHKLTKLRPSITPRTYQNSVSNPQDYMSILVKKPQTFAITDAMTGQGTFYLEIDKDTIQECLCDNEGNVDIDLKNKFEEFHKKIAQKLYIDCQTNLKYYRKRTKLDAKDSFYTQAILKAIQRSYQEFEQIPLKAADITRRIFQLSKTPMGYDFEDFDVKYSLAKSAIQQTDIYEKPYFDETFKTIVEYTRDERGNFDTRLVMDVLDVEKAGGYCDRLEDIIANVKKYVWYDEISATEIVDMMCDLCKEPNFALGSDYFEFLMELCFNKNKEFSVKKSDAVMNGIYAIKDILELASNKEEETRTIVTLKKESDVDSEILNEGCGLIGRYFEENTDENGDLIENCEDIQEYIEENLQHLALE